jgi:hypothetical protein
MAKVMPTSRCRWMGSRGRASEQHWVGDGPELHTWVIQQDAVDARPTRRRAGGRMKGQRG